MSCLACRRGFHQHCRKCVCCEPTPACPVQDDGVVCGKPATRTGLIFACGTHTVRTLLMIGSLAHAEATTK